MARKNLKLDLNPLFSGPSLESRVKSGSPYRLLPLSEIDVDPEQPRRKFDTEALAELAASIKEYGVLAPILVRVTAGGTYRVVAGERRLRACRLLGLDVVPAIIDSEDTDEKDTLGKQLVENLQRQDLSALERAQSLGQLRDKHSWSVREIARRLGISKSLAQRSLDLLTLPEDLQAALIAGASETKVVLLQQIEDREMRKELLAQLGELSREALEEKISFILTGIEDPEKLSHGGTGKKSAKLGKGLSTEDRRLMEELQRSLGMKVHITRAKSKAGQGRISVDFYSAEDLSELHRRLTDS